MRYVPSSPRGFSEAAPEGAVRQICACLIHRRTSSFSEAAPEGAVRLLLYKSLTCRGFSGNFSTLRAVMAKSSRFKEQEAKGHPNFPCLSSISTFTHPPAITPGRCPRPYHVATVRKIGIGAVTDPSRRSGAHRGRSTPRRAGGSRSCRGEAQARGAQARRRQADARRAPRDDPARARRSRRRSVHG